MLTLYGVARSRASRNIWLAEELGLELERVPVIQAYRLADPLAPDAALNTRSEDFVSITQTSAIPCLVDDGFVLTESLAINFYLGRLAGGPLTPDDPQEEAATLQWSFYAATSIEQPALAILYAHADGFAGSGDESATTRAAIAANADKLRPAFAVLDAHLAHATYIIGARFTLADINVAECVRYAQSHPTLLAEFPALNGWLTTCQARPAFRAMWEQRLAEPE